MSYGFMGWAVDIDKLVEVCGSKDEKLRRMICGRFKHDLASLDSSFDYAIRGGAPTTKEAISALIHGEEMKGHGFMYAYAFKLIVWHFGKMLDNSGLYPTGTSFPDEVDAVLKAGGVTAFSLSNLSYGTLPVSFPRPGDFPGFGHMTAAQVLEAQRQLEAFKWDGSDYDMESALKSIRSWVNDAAGLQRGIVAYFH